MKEPENPTMGESELVDSADRQRWLRLVHRYNGLRACVCEKIRKGQMQPSSACLL